jgi:Family of unknown function (DUF6289)
MSRRLGSVLSALTLLTSGLLLGATPAQAAACPLGWECVTTYYSDNTHTTAVGGKVEYCDGSADSWGTRSGYIDFHRQEC